MASPSGLRMRVVVGCLAAMIGSEGSAFAHWATTTDHNKAGDSRVIVPMGQSGVTVRWVGRVAEPGNFVLYRGPDPLKLTTVYEHPAVLGVHGYYFRDTLRVLGVEFYQLAYRDRLGMVHVLAEVTLHPGECLKPDESASPTSERSAPAALTRANLAPETDVSFATAIEPQPIRGGLSVAPARPP